MVNHLDMRNYKIGKCSIMTEIAICVIKFLVKTK